MKKALSSLALASVLALPFAATTSCNGTFSAFNGLSDWNDDVTDQDWVNEIIFLGLIIVPVYQLALLGDVLIFNTVEYWSGDNPIGEIEDEM